MARISDIPPGKVPADVRDVDLKFAGGYGPFRDQVGVFAHVPSSVKHLMGMLLERREQKNVPFRYIEFAMRRLNHRPRKCLVFKTPYEVFIKQLHSRRNAVALQT